MVNISSHKKKSRKKKKAPETFFFFVFSTLRELTKSVLACHLDIVRRNKPHKHGLDDTENLDVVVLRRKSNGKGRQFAIKEALGKNLGLKEAGKKNGKKRCGLSLCKLLIFLLHNRI
eukprot:TRINITY_DN14468_c0_g1_i1.p1 TRINITY_DN14468_c0_g1~~TRINITY_DN14468_c0_g1_i1.p1  ORF type:complete len:117 (-),score=0.13 TRINITY_DN14468_c0_g1_i1:170-520(-)